MHLIAENGEGFKELFSSVSLASAGCLLSIKPPPLRGIIDNKKWNPTSNRYYAIPFCFPENCIKWAICIPNTVEGALIVMSAIKEKVNVVWVLDKKEGNSKKFANVKFHLKL